MKAGFAAADITPRLGLQLAGYGPYRNRAANKILAPLSARALAVSDGNRQAILVNVELCGTPRPLAIRMHQSCLLSAACCRWELSAAPPSSVRF